jgi:hypothetical protein
VVVVPPDVFLTREIFVLDAVGAVEGEAETGGIIGVGILADDS